MRRSWKNYVKNKTMSADAKRTADIAFYLHHLSIPQGYAVSFSLRSFITASQNRNPPEKLYAV